MAAAAVLALAIGLAAARAEAPAAAGDLKVLKTVIGGGEGGWDYITADQQGKLAYVSRGTKFMVFDIEQGKVTGEITDTPGSHGIALVPELGLGFTTNGQENMMSVVDLKTLKTTRKIKAGEKPDAIMYDPGTKKIFCCNGKSGDLTVVDPAALDKDPVTIPVGGKLEAAVADGAGHVYVNVEDKNEVAAVDAKTLKVTAHWPLAPGEGPTGLAIDVAKRRLFAGCAGKMIVLDADKGTVLADVATGQGVDGVAFDPVLGVAVSSNGRDGTMTVVREGPAGKFAAVQTVKTFKSTRTIAVDLKTHRFYMPANIPNDSGKTEFGIVVVGLAGM